MFRVAMMTPKNALGKDSMLAALRHPHHLVSLMLGREMIRI
jgi:hypothetical protein